MNDSSTHYKVRLASGRILGPIDRDRVIRFIIAGHISGEELARRLPDGEWQAIRILEPLNQDLLAHALGQLKAPTVSHEIKDPPADEPTAILEPSGIKADGDATRIGGLGGEDQTVVGLGDEDHTVVGVTADPTAPPPSVPELESIPQIQPRVEDKSVETPAGWGQESVHAQKTQLLQRSRQSDTEELPVAGSKAGTKKKANIRVVALILGTLVALELFDDEVAPVEPQFPKTQRMRPSLPVLRAERPNPAVSSQLYSQALKLYLTDTLDGYVQASKKFRQAVEQDSGNVKALAMLASSYLNLVEVSFQDEAYFGVISKLVDLSQSKSIQLSETLFAEAEFLVLVKNPEAAQAKIVEFTEKTPGYGADIFFLMAWVQAERNAWEAAKNLLSHIPEKDIFSPRVYELRARIARQLAPDQVAAQYEEGLKKYPNHARLTLGLADTWLQVGSVDKAAILFGKLEKRVGEFVPSEQAKILFGAGIIQSRKKNWDRAEQSLRWAHQLMPGDLAYLLEWYNARSHVGKGTPEDKTNAKMLLLLVEAEQLAARGNFKEALDKFLEAKQAAPQAAEPAIRMGEYFISRGNLVEAAVHYRRAARLLPTSASVWRALTHLLIETYEWQEAQEAMLKLKEFPEATGWAEKLSGDLFAKQGKVAQAIQFYRKAMSRNRVDSAVYLSYARVLMAAGNFQDAPFFLALALRQLPESFDIALETARCWAQTDSIDRAIRYLEEWIERVPRLRVDLESAIAEFQIQKGDLDPAESRLNNLIEQHPEAGVPWRVLGLVELARESRRQPEALDRAIRNYRSYVDRTPSDPEGLLQLYRLYLRKTQFEKAEEALAQIYGLIPKYPSLHFFRGELYFQMGNYRTAIQEYQTELANHPDDTKALVALGKAYIEVQQPDEALKRFTRAMQLSPRFAEAKHYAGFGNYLLKNYAGAIALYQSAIRLDPGNPMIYKRLGVAYRALGEPGKAADAFRKYLDLAPDAPDRAEFLKYL